MRWTVGFLSLLAALVPTVHGLSCITCAEEGSRTCDGASVQCPPDKVCGTSLIEVTRKDGLKFYTIRRYCRYSDRCGVKAHFSYTNYRSRQQITCCTTDNCTPPEPTWLDVKDDIYTNGLSCPTCVYPGFDCLAKDNIDCVGEENKCYTQFQTYKGPWLSAAMIYRGCTTERVCGFGKWTELYGGVTVDSNVTCREAENSNANAGPQSAFLFVALHFLVFIILF